MKHDFLRACETSTLFAARPICEKALMVSLHLFRILLNWTHIAIPSSYFLERARIAINVCTSMGMASLENGKLQWPKDEKEVRNLSQQELRWLLEGLSLQQPKAIAKSVTGVFLNLFT